MHTYTQKALCVSRLLCSGGTDTPITNDSNTLEVGKYTFLATHQQLTKHRFLHHFDILDQPTTRIVQVFTYILCKKKLCVLSYAVIFIEPLRNQQTYNVGASIICIPFSHISCDPSEMQGVGLKCMQVEFVQAETSIH